MDAFGLNPSPIDRTMNTILHPLVHLVPSAILAAFLLTGCSSPGPDRTARVALRQSLTLHASFDHGVDADFARGNRKLRNAPSLAKQAESLPGLPAGGEVVVARGEGITGDALRFVKAQSPVVHFAALGNVAWNPTNWSGTVSFWLRLDPETDLEPGYTDPIQLTDKGWDNSAFFIEFTKDDKPRQLRLGAYADTKVWNPAGRKWDDMAFEEKPLVKVVHPPFGRERWTHVAFTWERFNTGHADGVARLYLNGALQGTLTARTQTFSWDPAKALVMLGMSYTGLWDELAIFDRRLTDGEVALLTGTPGILGEE